MQEEDYNCFSNDSIEVFMIEHYSLSVDLFCQKEDKTKNDL